jgi:hypothetical protein
MWRKMKLSSMWINAVMAALFVTCAVAAGVLWAAKPAPPAPATGVIYFRWPVAFDGESTGTQVHVMNATDGSGKTAVTPKKITGQPSHQPYQDLDPITGQPTGEPYRWFVRVADGAWDSPEVIKPELAVFRTVFDGNGVPTADQFTLTDLNDGYVMPTYPDPIYPLYNDGSPQFSNDGLDNYIWFLGYRKNTDSYNIYRIPFTVDPTSGVPSADQSQLQLVVSDSGDLRFSAWGNTLAFQVLVGTQTDIWIATIDGDGNVTTMKVSDHSGGYLQISPNDGRRIAFVEDGSVKVLDIETGLVTTVYKPPTDRRAERPFWSPDAQHLCFQLKWSRDDVLRIPASGGKAVWLTKDLPTGSWPVGWRK